VINHLREDFGVEPVCVAFVTDVYSRKIIGWNWTPTCAPTWPLDALEMTTAMRKPASGSLIHHSDKGCQLCRPGTGT
jgi:putative transposase